METYFSPNQTIGATNSNVVTRPDTLGEAQNCYIPIAPAPTWPYQYPSYRIWTNAPVMRPHVCPVCQGRETVKAGFYREVSKEDGPQKCRACSGKGLVYTP